VKGTRRLKLKRAGENEANNLHTTMLAAIKIMKAAGCEIKTKKNSFRPCFHG
jgi:hypothetical protein